MPETRSGNDYDTPIPREKRVTMSAQDTDTDASECIAGNDGHPIDAIEYPYGQLGESGEGFDHDLYCVGKCMDCGQQVEVHFDLREIVSL